MMDGHTNVKNNILRQSTR